MLRQILSRNSRSRRLKPKDALRVSLILAVSIWLLYHLMQTNSNNSIIDSYTRVRVRQENNIHQENTLDLHRQDVPATTDTRNVVEFEKVEIERVDKLHEQIGVSEDVSEESDVEKGEESGKRMKEHEARERSFKGDDPASAVHHDNQPEIKEESATGIATDLENENTEIDDKTFDIILGNATINETGTQKNISRSGSFSDKPDENLLLVNLNETYMVDGLVQDARDAENRERS